MRLSDLLGRDVVDGVGRRLGRVVDVRLAADGEGPGFAGRLVVDGMLVSPRHPGSLLGYDRREEQGPWLVRTVVRRLQRDMTYVRWDDVAEWTEREIVVRAARRMLS